MSKFVKQIELSKLLVEKSALTLANAASECPGERERLILDATLKAMLRLETSLEAFVKEATMLDEARTLSAKGKVVEA